MARGLVFLLEAYPGAGDAAPPSLEALRADVEAHPGLQVIGLLAVPVDEALLCLVAAESAAAAAALRDQARRYGPAARLLRVSWAPSSDLAPVGDATGGPADAAVSP